MIKLYNILRKEGIDPVETFLMPFEESIDSRKYGGETIRAFFSSESVISNSDVRVKTFRLEDKYKTVVYRESPNLQDMRSRIKKLSSSKSKPFYIFGDIVYHQSKSTFSEAVQLHENMIKYLTRLVEQA